MLVKCKIENKDSLLQAYKAKKDFLIVGMFGEFLVHATVLGKLPFNAVIALALEGCLMSLEKSSFKEN